MYAGGLSLYICDCERAPISPFMYVYQDRAAQKCAYSGYIRASGDFYCADKNVIVHFVVSAIVGNSIHSHHPKDIMPDQSTS